jgi:hypothetical protein
MYNSQGGQSIPRRGLHSSPNQYAPKKSCCGSPVARNPGERNRARLSEKIGSPLCRDGRGGLRRGRWIGLRLLRRWNMLQSNRFRGSRNERPRVRHDWSAVRLQ